jgi:CheY-like chemotaxis protein
MPASRTPAVDRVLVVEDNRIAQQVISYVLSKQGFSHDCVGDGWAALEAAGRKQYSLVLMDLQMPGIDGLETTGRLRLLPSYASVPVLALTANSSDEVRHLCRQRGMDAYLTKPIQTHELVEALRQYLPGWAHGPGRPVV